MGTRYFLALRCPHCNTFNEDCYYAPTCDFTTHRCESCDKEFDIEPLLGQEFLDEVQEDIVSHREFMEQLVEGFIIEEIE